MPRRRKSVAVARQEPPLVHVDEGVDALPDTPLTLALAALIDVAQREGLHAAADRMLRDPQGLPALLAAQRAHVQAAWDLANTPATDKKFGEMMERLGLMWCSLRPVPGPWSTERAERYDRFRVSASQLHPSGASLPAIIAPIQNAYEQMMGLAIWFVKPDWSGLTDLEPKMIIMGEHLGHAVRLRPLGDRLVVALDLDGAAASFDRTGRPVWLALTFENLVEHFALPEGEAVHRDVIFWWDRNTREAVIKAARRFSFANPHCSVRLLSEIGPPVTVDDLDWASDESLRITSAAE